MSFHSASPEEPNLFPVNNNALPTNLTATFPSHAGEELPSSSSRSCVTCRRRKVRCNKRSPCSNCTKAGIDCIFPPPGRAPRKSKRPPDAELLSRLRRLEGVIDHLRSGGNTEGASTSAQAQSSTPRSSTSRSEPTAPTSASAEPQKPPNQADGGHPCPFEESDPKKLAPKKFENEFGRLVIDEGRSRYVSNRFWTSLGDEVDIPIIFFFCYLVNFILTYFRSRSCKISLIIHRQRKMIHLHQNLLTLVHMTASFLDSTHFQNLFRSFILPRPRLQYFGKNIGKMWLL